MERFLDSFRELEHLIRVAASVIMVMIAALAVVCLLMWNRLDTLHGLLVSIRDQLPRRPRDATGSIPGDSTGDSESGPS